jgi:hypothetical protein
MDPEALQISDAAFLATHQPLKMYRQRDIGDASTRTAYDERSFLRDFLRPSSYAFVPVLGDAGTGKSHLIKWLSVNIPEDANRRVLLIRKLGTNLRDVILQILSIKEADGPRFKEYRARVQNAANALTEGMARELLLSHLAAVIGPNGPHRMQGLTEEERYLAEHLPDLLHDPYFRQHLLADGGVIHGLVTHTIGSGPVQRRVERQGFKSKDLPEGLRDYERSGKAAQEIYIALAGHPALREAAVAWLNRHLDEAIRQVFSLGGQDLFNLMIDVRKALADRKEPIELVILIEDFAKLQGIDMQLLEALLVRPNQEQYGQLCALRVALACTSGYFRPLLDTVQQRAEFYVNLDVTLESGLVREDDAEGLVARYLNAVRVDESELRRWYERARTDAAEDRDPAPSACQACEHRDRCHSAFGEHEGFGLYPFNVHIINEGLRRVAGDHFNPRLLIRDVLKHVLQNYTADLREGRFPPPALHQHFGGTYRQGMDPLVRQDLRQRDPQNHQRRAVLLDLWSDRDGVQDLNEGVHEAFSLSPLGGPAPAALRDVRPLPSPTPVPPPFAAHAAAGAVVDAVAALASAFVRDHHDGTLARVAREQDRVAGLIERRVLERVVLGRECAGRTLAVHPRGLFVHDLLASDVVADEVHKLANCAGQNFLKRVEDHCVDQHVIDRGEVRAQRHVVKIAIRMCSAEGSIDELLVVTRQGDAPRAEHLMERAELAGCELVAKGRVRFSGRRLIAVCKRVSPVSVPQPGALV